MTHETLRQVLALHGGVAPRKQLVAVVGKRALRTAVARGVVSRVARGRYTLPHLDDSAVAAVRLSATVSHRSARSTTGGP